MLPRVKEILRRSGWPNLRCEYPEDPASSTRADKSQDAVDLLNTLQTPYKQLKEREKAGFIIDEAANQEMRICLAQIGYSVSLHVPLVENASNVPIAKRSGQLEHRPCGRHQRQG
jgi:hypothetical protein